MKKSEEIKKRQPPKKYRMTTNIALKYWKHLNSVKACMKSRYRTDDKLYNESKQIDGHSNIKGNYTTELNQDRTKFNGVLFPVDNYRKRFPGRSLTDIRKSLIKNTDNKNGLISSPRNEKWKLNQIRLENVDILVGHFYKNVEIKNNIIEEPVDHTNPSDNNKEMDENKIDDLFDSNSDLKYKIEFDGGLFHNKEVETINKMTLQIDDPIPKVNKKPTDEEFPTESLDLLPSFFKRLQSDYIDEICFPDINEIIKDAAECARLIRLKSLDAPYKSPSMRKELLMKQLDIPSKELEVLAKKSWRTICRPQFKNIGYTSEDDAELELIKEESIDFIFAIEYTDFLIVQTKEIVEQRFKLHSLPSVCNEDIDNLNTVEYHGSYGYVDGVILLNAEEIAERHSRVKHRESFEALSHMYSLAHLLKCRTHSENQEMKKFDKAVEPMQILSSKSTEVTEASFGRRRDSSLGSFDRKLVEEFTRRLTTDDRNQGSSPIDKSDSDSTFNKKAS